jgi:histone deacetylase complex subunit SAP18
LNELALELAASEPSALPTPAIGMRLAFQLVYPDLRSTAGIGDAAPRFAVKDLGTVVIGQGGPGTGGPEEDAGGIGRTDNSGGKTLSDARFVVGDYISCAILTQLPNGSVAPAANARREPVLGSRGGRQGYRGGFFGNDGGHGRNRRDDWRETARWSSRQASRSWPWSMVVLRNYTLQFLPVPLTFPIHHISPVDNCLTPDA